MEVLSLRKVRLTASVMLSVLAGSQCFAQEPRIAGVGPTMSVSVGYVYLSAEVPNANRISERGVATSFTIDFTRFLGVKAEASYTRSYGAFGLPHHNDALAYLAGPIVYPVRCKRFAAYGDTLFGAVRVVGMVAHPTEFGITGGMVNHFAWSLGGGVETALSPSIAARTGADYLHASFFVPNGNIRPQGNLRAMTSLVYTFGKK
jgi:opacity protein-like surface antigen